MQSITARNCISQSISYILITIDRRIDDSKGSPGGELASECSSER